MLFHCCIFVVHITLLRNTHILCSTSLALTERTIRLFCELSKQLRKLLKPQPKNCLKYEMLNEVVEMMKFMEGHPNEGSVEQLLQTLQALKNTQDPDPRPTRTKASVMNPTTQKQRSMGRNLVAEFIAAAHTKDPLVTAAVSTAPPSSTAKKVKKERDRDQGKPLRREKTKIKDLIPLPPGCSAVPVPVQASPAAAAAAALAELVDSDHEELEAYDEDLKQINMIIFKLEPLSLDVLKDLSDFWSVSFSSGGDHLLYRTNITERIRYLSAMNFICVAEKFRCLPDNRDQQSESERAALVNNFVLSLWQSVHYLASKFKDQLAILFDLDPVKASAEDICTMITGLGITSFFQPLPPALLERVCRELRLSVESREVELRQETLVHRICAFLYPVLGDTRNDMKLQCTARLAINEHAPGNYTCVIHNASMLNVAQHHSITSNTFTNKKVKWRGRLTCSNNVISFGVLQRSEDYSLRLCVRTTSETKGSRAKGTAKGLLVDTTGTCTPNNEITVSNLFTLQDAWNAPTTSATGLRLYNKCEDRIVFHFTMELQDSTPTASGASSAHGEKDIRDSTRSPQPPPSETGTDQSAPLSKKTADEAIIADLLAQEESEKKQKVTQTKKQKLEKRLKQLEQTETQERDKLCQSAQTASTQLLEEERRAAQKALQRKRERERKVEITKLQPSVDLQTQLSAAMQQLSSSRSVIAKLNQEKATAQKEYSRIVSALEARRASLTELKQHYDTSAEKLTDLVKLRDELRTKKRAAEEAQERRSAAASQLNFSTSPSNTAGAAAIRDFQSFWNTAGDEPAIVPSPQKAPAVVAVGEPVNVIRSASLSEDVFVQPSPSRPPLASTSSTGAIPDLVFGTNPQFLFRQTNHTPPAQRAFMATNATAMQGVPTMPFFVPKSNTPLQSPQRAALPLHQQALQGMPGRSMLTQQHPVPLHQQATLPPTPPQQWAHLSTGLNPQAPSWKPF